MADKKRYRNSSLSQGKCVELHARSVADGALWGFTTVTDLAFDIAGEGIVVDPAEERLREACRDTGVLHLPMYAVLRIKEIDRTAAAGSATPPAATRSSRSRCLGDREADEPVVRAPRLHGTI